MPALHAPFAEFALLVLASALVGAVFVRVRQPRDELAAQVVVFGLVRDGSQLLQPLQQASVQAIGVKFDPQALRALRYRKLPTHVGDGEDPGILESLPLRHVRWAVTALPCWGSNRTLLHALREVAFRGRAARETGAALALLRMCWPKARPIRWCPRPDRLRPRHERHRAAAAVEGGVVQ